MGDKKWSLFIIKRERDPFQCRHRITLVSVVVGYRVNGLVEEDRSIKVLAFFKKTSPNRELS